MADVDHGSSHAVRLDLVPRSEGTRAVQQHRADEVPSHRLQRDGCDQAGQAEATDQRADLQLEQTEDVEHGDDGDHRHQHPADHVGGVDPNVEPFDDQALEATEGDEDRERHRNDDRDRDPVPHRDADDGPSR